MPAPPTRTSFTVPEPPTPEVSTPLSWSQLLLPALSSASMLIFGLASNDSKALLVGVVVCVGSVGAQPILHRANRRTSRQRMAQRRASYVAALEQLGQDVGRAQDQARAVLTETHPEPAALAPFAAGPRLWERRLADKDFLDVALGTGSADSEFAVEHADDRLYLDARPDTDLLTAAKSLADQARTVPSAPVVLSLRDNPVLAVTGDRAGTLGLVRAVLAELAVCCGPDELQIAVAAPVATERDWDWLAWLPHCSSRVGGAAGSRRAATLIATSEAAVGRLLAQTVTPRVRLPRDDGRRDGAVVLPHLVLVVDQFDPVSALQHLPALWEALRDAAALAVTVITICPRIEARPEETTVCLEFPTPTLARLDHLGDDPWTRALRPRRLEGTHADQVGRILTDCRPVGEAVRLSRVDSDRLFDLLSLGALPAGPPSWPSMTERDLLRVPIGGLPDGRPLELDLKESATGGHGPHGLVIGATGSGKSELLRGVVTALALRHSPDDLAMVFADFKGGATFDLLSDLPHRAAFITNLEEDLSLVDRMKAALSGEQNRRQELLRGAGRDVQNIAQYRRLRSADPTLPPLPYLLLVVDEFGELLEARPDFLEVFLTIGRTGRSLGIHMMLASQRLDAGRIRGLESYLSYRLSLRTFTAEESVAAIGNRLAYELPALPGHGYFRSGDLFTRFKAARVTVTSGRVDVVPAKGAASRQASSAGTDETDLTRAVSWLRAYPTRVAPLWLEPLPAPSAAASLTIDDPRLWRDLPVDPAGVPVPIGLVDLPQRRSQPPLVYDAAQLDGHLAIVGAPQSGKSTCLRTIVTAAARRHSPRLVQFYGVDLGAGGLALLGGLPHLGAVAVAAEPDRVRRVFAEFEALLDERARRFRALGIASMTEWLARVRAGEPEADRGHVVLLIDGYRALRQRFPELEEAFGRFLAEGPSFGVHVVFTSGRWADIRPQHLDSVGTRVELRLNDPLESQFSRVLAAGVPRAMPGRGLVAGGMATQVALPASDESLAKLVGELSASAGQRWPDSAASPLVMLADLRRDTWRRLLRREAAAGRACVGVSEQGPQAVAFESRAGNLLHLVGDAGSGRTALLARLAGDLTGVTGQAGPLRLYVVDYRGDLARRLRGAGLEFTGAHLPDELKTLIPDLEAALASRRSAVSAALGAPQQTTGAAAAVPQAGTAQPNGAPLLLLVDDFELVHATTPGPFMKIAPYLAYGPDLAFGVALAQAARGVGARTGDQFVRALIEQDAQHLFFSVETRNDLMPFNGRRGQILPPHTATLQRARRPDTLILTTEPA
jgi:S-DNA-T family DNA segregation ATPase FtsK/SpoIIIE